MRRALPIVSALALVVVLVIGLTQAGGQGGGGGAAETSEPFDLQRALDRLEGAPPALAALHDQAAELLDGGPKALDAQLRELRGHPVVINKWASWCGPCRHEFPFFQEVATDRGDEIAFLGLNSGDGTAPAREFLDEFPVPFPSFEDPDEDLARAVGAPANYPITVFLDERGETAFIRQGGYSSREKLEADLDRYLGS